jgi:hypothetical protein
LNKTALNVKQSFDQRLKRQGISSPNNNIDTNNNNLIDRFKGLDFWIWDKDKHEKEFDRILAQSYSKACADKVACCFNHAIGLPVKNDISHPIYQWQHEIFDALQRHKLIAILKARGIGASEFLLRYAMWLCLKDNQMQGKNMAIVTGIREDLSLELIRRFKNLMPDFQWNGPSNVAEINGCRVIGYPSKRVKDLRGLTDVSFVICDEFAFFDPSDQQQILPVLEAFQAKSDPTICLLSTPGPMHDVMYNLYQEPSETCRYHRLYIPWQKAVGTLFNQGEIEKSKRQPNFQQEFELRFGSHGTGTIFSLADIDFAINLGTQYANPNFNPKAAKCRYPYIEEDAEIYAIGADPGGWGHSKFGICMIGLFDDRLHVLVAEEHAQVDEDEMIKRLLLLRSKTPHPKQTKIFIDGANISFIKRLKSCIPDERIDYQEYMEDLRKRKLITPPDEAQAVHYMSIVPISFSKQGPKMLANLYAFLQRGDIAIHPKFTTLISALQSARNVPNRRNSQFILDKSSQSLDCLDALRLALFNFDAGAPDFDEEEEKGEVEEDNEKKVEEDITA